MSFSGDVKIALSKEIPERDCCLSAMLSGMLLFSAAQNGTFALKTESADASEAFVTLLSRIAGIAATVKRQGAVYSVIPDEKWANAIASSLSEVHIRELLVCEKCGAAFFRGAFLASGFVNPPEKPARLELSTPNADLACDAAAALTKHFRMPKLSVRRARQVLYFRDTESLEYFLSYIGANKAAFAVINAQMLKEKRREINRRANFEVANIEKTVNAAALYTDAIRALMASGDFEKLPPELRTTARLRLENDTLTLSELALLTEPPISKSQISKRLKRIYDFYLSKESQAPKGGQA